MSTVIYKQEIHLGVISIQVPARRKFLQVQKQNEAIVVWYQCDPSAELVWVDLLVIGTGQIIPEGSWEYMNTFQDEYKFVWHAFYKR